MDALVVEPGRRGVLQPVVVALGLTWTTLALLQFPHLLPITNGDVHKVVERKRIGWGNWEGGGELEEGKQLVHARDVDGMGMPS